MYIVNTIDIIVIVFNITTAFHCHPITQYSDRRINKKRKPTSLTLARRSLEIYIGVYIKP